MFQTTNYRWNHPTSKPCQLCKKGHSCATAVLLAASWGDLKLDFKGDFMDLNGILMVGSMDFNGFQWILIGFQWILMDLNRILMGS